MSEEKFEENVNSEPETFIVQNRTPGPHFVSDIKLNFDPEEVIDLTKEAQHWVDMINDCDSIERLKQTYAQAYNTLSKDKSAVAKISAAKDAKKAELGA